jgi:hypothetical protein
MRHVLLAALLLTGCQTTWPEGATITSSTGQKLCARHHTPLVTVPVFQAPTHDTDRVILVYDGTRRYYYGIVAERYPNIFPQHVSCQKIWILTEPTTIQYCLQCQAGFLKDLRVTTESAAIEYATYYVQIRQWDSVIPCAGPFRATLNNGIWTVVCSLTDGGLAVVRISKEEGSVVSSKRIAAKSPNQALERTDSADRSHIRFETLHSASPVAQFGSLGPCE